MYKAQFKKKRDHPVKHIIFTLDLITIETISVYFHQTDRAHFEWSNTIFVPGFFVKVDIIVILSVQLAFGGICSRSDQND